MNLSTACRLFGISRQAIYKQNQASIHKQAILSKVVSIVRRQRMDMPRLGTRKLHHLLKQEFIDNDIKIGRDGLFNYLRASHMLIRPKKNYTRTTWSKHWLRKHPNLVKDVSVNRAEQLWVSDITYVKTQDENCFLSLVTDAYSRKIMGYHVSDNLKAESVMLALEMAISRRMYTQELIHHSDRGIQYCAEPYQNMLLKYGMKCSMTDGYDCYQNALAERMNGILKHEFLLHVPKNMEQLKKMVVQSVNVYNTKRPHLALNMKTPDQKHKEKSLVDSSTRENINL